MEKNNRIFCTFSSESTLGEVVDSVKRDYTILYSKIFILFSEESGDYLVTYNLEFPNLSSFPRNTILVHRHKDTNTLYTINALNLLISTLNNGVASKVFKVNWQEYQNCLLLLRDRQVNRLNTVLYKIIKL